MNKNSFFQLWTFEQCVDGIVFLCSLFGYYRDASGERLRVFWIPVKLAEGAPGLAGAGFAGDDGGWGVEDAVLRNALGGVRDA